MPLPALPEEYVHSVQAPRIRTLIVNVCEFVCCGEAESATPTVSVDVPGVVGVPDTRPEELSVMPGGGVTNMTTDMNVARESTARCRTFIATP
jgi:hypothetical protein